MILSSLETKEKGQGSSLDESAFYGPRKRCILINRSLGSQIYNFTKQPREILIWSGPNINIAVSGSKGINIKLYQFPYNQS